MSIMLALDLFLSVMWQNSSWNGTDSKCEDISFRIFSIGLHSGTGEEGRDSGNDCFEKPENCFSKEDFLHPIQCIAQAMKHGIFRRHYNSRRDDYVCDRCGFCLSFYRRKRDDCCFLQENHSSLTVNPKCPIHLWAKICSKRLFVTFKGLI